jgi:hypothetical protein
VILWALACMEPDPGLDPSPVGAPTAPDSTAPDPVPDEPPDPTQDEYAFPFDGEVHLLELELGQDEMLALAKRPDEYVPGRLVYGEEVYEPIGVRLKGNGSFQPIDQKPSFKLKFDEYVEDLEFHGLQRLVLNNMTNDPTCMHERVAHRVFRAAGVPDVRAGHAWVKLGQSDYGLYSLVENIDEDFLERWYAEPDGPMWEMFDVDFHPDNVGLFEHEEGEDDRAVLMAVAEILESRDDGDWAALAPYVDQASFLRYFATAAVVGQFDAYPYSYPGDDLHLYLDPADGKLDFLPHGADETYEDAERPITFVYGSLAVACLDDPACAETFASQVWEVQRLSYEIKTRGYLAMLEEKLRPYVLADERRPWTLREVDLTQGYMERFVEERPAELAEHIEAR